MKRLTKILTAATVAGALGFGGIGVASADPGSPLPAKPGPCGRGLDCGPGPGPGGPGPGWQGPGRGGPGPDWQGPHDDNWNAGRDFNVGSRDWWRGRPGKRWRDDDLPPWGFWGPPPAYQWSGPPPWVNPQSINYWGYQATPVWDDGFHGWGIWLFGIWIPIVGIGAY
jgi:hypothetical protein